MTFLLTILKGASAGVPFLTLDPVSEETGSIKDVFIEEQLPDFIVAGGSIDHTKFVDFLKAYYKFMGTKGNPAYESFGLLDNKDVDSSIDTFFDFITDEFMSEFPKTMTTGLNKDNFVKNVKDFYKIKGTEESYKILFRVLFNEEIDFYYPKTDIIKASDGKWTQPNVLKLTRGNTESDLHSMIGKRLEQKNEATGTVTAYGDVESVVLYENSGYSVAEVDLSNVFGTFQPEKYVECEISSTSTVREYVYPTLSSLIITNGGTGYSVNDSLNISGGLGVGADAVISSTNSKGEILKTKIIDGGINYRATDDLTVSITSNGGSSAVLGASGGNSIEARDGFFETEDGLLGVEKYIQDSYYYQDFSYVIRTAKNFSEYKDTVKRIAHPAGVAMFGTYLLKDLITLSESLTETSRKSEIPILGHYTPYRFETIRNLRANGAGGSGGTDLYPEGYGLFYAEGNSYAVETGSTASAISGTVLAGPSGPLGGSTHSSWHDVNTLDIPVREQFAVVDGSITGGTFADYWLIYPHPNSRGITNIPFSGLGRIDRLQCEDAPIPQSTASLSSKIIGTKSTLFGLGDYVRQQIPKSQDAIGYVHDMFQTGNDRFYDVITISGKFMNSSTPIFDEVAGPLEGVCGGLTIFINSVENLTTSHENETKFSTVKAEDFMFGIER
jgi:hypothetical protein